MTWGGWSPELLDVELTDWPPSVRTALRTRYFAEASRHIGVKETNDFIYGPLHTALRKQLDDGLNRPATRPDLPLPICSIIRRFATPIRESRH